MPLLTPHHLDRRLPVAIAGTAALALLGFSFAQAPSAGAADADTRVMLGTTEQFAVLAGAGITNTGATSIQGDIGSFPTTDQTIPDVTLDGTNHAGDAVTQQAKDDLVTAYDDAAGALPPTSVEVELGGKTLVGGVYKGATELGLTGTLTLDGGRTDGLPSNKVFIFQAGTTLITEVNSAVVLTGGAQACNVFWQVGSAATFKTGTVFRGTVMAYTEAITAQQGATFEGRLLARTAAVTLENNTITRPSCATSPEEGADADGTDADGTDTDVTDTGGNDTGGTDADGTDTDGPAGGEGAEGEEDGTGGDSDVVDGGGAGDGSTQGDGTDGGGAADGSSGAGSDGGSGSSSGSLPDAGGPGAWLLAGGLSTLIAGSALVLGRRHRTLRAD